jgi:hypothetical protein
MTIHIVYTETAGEFMGRLQVTESNGSVRDCYIPKILVDLIKSKLTTAPINWTNLLARTESQTFDLA